MFIANELKWNMLNDAFIGAMEENAEVFSNLEEGDPLDLDEQLRNRDIMFSMQ